MKTRKYYLTEQEMPENYYNIQADMPNMMQPPLHPGTLQPVGPDDLAPLFPMELIKQEVSQERFIPIPEEVRHLYSIFRPSPLIRATFLEKALDTPAHIIKFITYSRLRKVSLYVKRQHPSRES